MDKENLYEYFKRMINSAAKQQKYMSISPVYVAGIIGGQPSDVEQYLQEFVSEGRLIKSKLQDPPHFEIYSLPSVNSPS